MAILAFTLSIIIAASIFFLKQSFIYVLLGTSLFTLIFHIFTQLFYFWRNWQVLGLELLLNCLFAGLLFFIFSFLIDKRRIY